MGKMTEKAQAKAALWLEKNGFDKDGYTYILIGINSYVIKEELKGAGWVYSPILRWHKADPGDYPNNVKRIHWQSFFTLMAWGDFVPAEDAQARIDAFIAEALPPSTSKYVGNIGDRLKKIPATLQAKHSFTGQYGITQVLTFTDSEGNIFTWFTSSCPNIEPSTSCLLSGTVKEHKNYKGNKTTILTRCRIYEAE
jgi:hypothetical protein